MIQKIFIKISARNQIKGTIVSIQEGVVNGIVTVDIGNGKEITSTISMNSIQELGLEKRKEAYAVIKAAAVMIGIERLGEKIGNSLSSLGNKEDQLFHYCSNISLAFNDKKILENSLKNLFYSCSNTRAMIQPLQNCIEPLL
ncbi:TOBE domain-containing protein [Gallicola sp. Sow4_E12]|uniref:TOBE domain-containing protein n=1 Tax=Gallicola sp. Sow4_E12 TaxID=3438785 RepID=UPI003F92270E